MKKFGKEGIILVLIVVVCAFIARFASRGDTLSEYAVKNETSVVKEDDAAETEEDAAKTGEDDAAEADAVSSDEENAASQALAAAKTMAGAAVQIDGNRLYVFSDGRLVGYPVDGDGAETLLFENDDNNYREISYHATGGHVYLLQRIYGVSDRSELFLIDPDTGARQLLYEEKDIGYSSVVVDPSDEANPVLYLQADENANRGIRVISFAVKSDGTIDPAKKNEVLPARASDDKLMTVQYNGGGNTSYATQTRTNGKFFCRYPDDDGAYILCEREADGSLRDLGEAPAPFNMIGMTGDALVFSEYEYDDEENIGTRYYRMSLTDGERGDFLFLKDGALRYGEALLLEDGILLPFADNDTKETGIAFASFDGNLKELFRKASVPSLYASDEILRIDVFGMLDGHIVYVITDEDYRKRAYVYDTATEKETALAGDALSDEKWDILGLTFVRKQETYHFRNDPEMPMLIRNTVSYAQLAGTSDAVKKINDVLRADAEEGLVITGREEADSNYIGMIENDGFEPDQIDTYDKDELPSGGMLLNTYDYNFSDVSYLDDDHVCIGVSTYLYLGGAHGNGATYYMTFDRKSGDLLELSDLLDMDQDSFHRVLAAAVADAVLNEDIWTYDGDDALNLSREELTEKYYEDFSVREWGFIHALCEDGLSIEFAPYDLGPYAAGQQAVTLSYDPVKKTVSVPGRE